jgi:hypothetical protein
MNDERRLELEQYFDGELSPDRHAEIARLLRGDGEARLYLRRLTRLRNLARSHERAARRRASRVLLPPPPRSRAPRVLAVATAALAASVAAAIVWRGRTASEVPGASSPTTIVAPGPIAAPPERTTLIREVELYTWANRNHRRPEAAASAILFSGARPGKRPAAVEILALDLVNAAPGLAEELEPIAVLRKSPRGGRGRAERHARRPRPAAPRT